MSIIEFIEWVSRPNNYEQAIKSCIDMVNRIFKEL